MRPRGKLVPVGAKHYADKTSPCSSAPVVPRLSGGARHSAVWSVRRRPALRRFSCRAIAPIRKSNKYSVSFVLDFLKLGDISSC